MSSGEIVISNGVSVLMTISFFFLLCVMSCLIIRNKSLEKRIYGSSNIEPELVNLESKIIDLETENLHLKQENFKLTRKNADLIFNQWLSWRDERKPIKTQFTKEQINYIRRKCHPDKNSQSEKAVEITQVCNDILNRG